MNVSTKSFEYISGEDIEVMLKAMDFSKANNLKSVINQQCNICRVHDWVDNLTAESSVGIDLEDIQRKVEQLNLPELDIVHNMSLNDITAYEAMIVHNLEKIPQNHNISALFLLHLKIIKNHLIYKFRIFE